MEILDRIAQNILNPLIYLLFALALFYFTWGLFVFLLNRDSEQEFSTGKRHMIWGLVGMAIMAGAFGIVSIIVATFNLNL